MASQQLSLNTLSDGHSLRTDLPTNYMHVEDVSIPSLMGTPFGQIVDAQHDVNRHVSIPSLMGTPFGLCEVTLREFIDQVSIPSLMGTPFGLSASILDHLCLRSQYPL